MELSTTNAGWLGLGVVLFSASFGATGWLWLLLYCITFVFGSIVMLGLLGNSKMKHWLHEMDSILVAPPSVGLTAVVEELCQGKRKRKTDKRMTGSYSIDDVIQELLDFTYRDYIHCWYRRISDDDQFQHDIHTTLQRVVIAFSGRAKDVDFVPYLTTQLIDDFASHIKLYRQALEKLKENQKDKTKPPLDLEAIFFDLETKMEGDLCRDMICLSDEDERQYLQDLCEALLFLLLPSDDFHNKPFRYIVREVLVNGIFLPTLNLISDPDYINQTISWLCKETSFSSEMFLCIIKTTDSVDELQAVNEMLDLEITRQRSKDTGGDDDGAIKRQLNSLMYVKRICVDRVQRLLDGLEEPDLFPMGVDLSKMMAPGEKLYSIPFDVVLSNNVSLSYFLDYMTNIGAQAYVFFYLAVECYRVSAEQQISASVLAEGQTDGPDLEVIKEAAVNIFDQYLAEKVTLHLKIDEALVTSLRERIYYDPPSDSIFDDVQNRVWSLLQEEEIYYPAFRKSQLYVKLLIELDLLKEQKTEYGSADEESGCSSPNSPRTDVTGRDNSADDLSPRDAASSRDVSPVSDVTSPKTYTLTASIITTGTCREHGKTYAVYLIAVKRDVGGGEDVWDVYRRYSDFHQLHTTIIEKFQSLAWLSLPGKKTFNNMNQEFLEKRRVALNAYLQALLNPNLVKCHAGLLDLVYQFLEHVHWEKEKSQLARKVDGVVNPLKASVKNVGSMMRSMPDNFADGVARMSGGLRSIPNNVLDGMGRILNVKMTGSLPLMKPPLMDSEKVGASLDAQGVEENIPLRIMMLLLDEVFDLKGRTQWLHRRIVTILQHFIRTLFGDSFNRKIVDHVEWMTSAEQIAEYIRTFKETFWPNGTLAETPPPRDENTKLRTRVVCKAKLLGTVSDELKTLLGSETTRLGAARVFTLVQRQPLNKRFCYVCLEAILTNIFPDNRLPELFRQLHSRSTRVGAGARGGKEGAK